MAMNDRNNAHRPCSPPASSERRSRIMRAIRSQDTKPELQIRSRLHSAGLRFRCNYRIDLPEGRVRPDIVFTRRRVAVFVDGCFWHCCPDHGSKPKTNSIFWHEKLERNAQRDVRTNKILANAGWRVIRIWEHEDPDFATELVIEAIQQHSLKLGFETLPIRPN
ncbi:very short patch repair endonuclease [Brevibacterium luteolum]|uniref:very short patch repair endonuclease n=1 Tax=Brevibacterium luteolum TaxID=199591 RepID=UPI003B671FE8